MSNVIDTAFTLIRQLQGAIGGKTIRSGTETLTFSASTDSGAVTVTHGLPSASSPAHRRRASRGT
jgi:hypothetical protein